MKKHFSKIALLLAALMVVSVMPAMAIVRTPIKGVGFESQMIGNSENQVPYQIKEKDSASQYFKTDKTVVAVGVQVPSYNDSKGKITIKVFKWAGDYGSTVKTKPIAERTYENWADRANLELYFNGTEGGGEYMIDLSKGYDGVGVFVGQAESANQVTYFNGTKIKGGMRSYIKYSGSAEIPAIEGANLEETSAYGRIPAGEADYLAGATVNNLGASDVIDDITQYVLGGNSTAGTGIGATFGYANVDFGTDGAKGVKVSVLNDSSQVQKVQVVLDNPLAEPIGEGTYVDDQLKSGWYDLPIDFKETVTGVHNVYFVMRGDYTPVKVRYVEFSKTAVENTEIEERIAKFKADPAPVYRDTYADTWAGADLLGRHLPSHEQVGDYNPDKTVGLFYWSWHSGGNDPARKVFNITQTLKNKPDLLEEPLNPEWGDITNTNWMYEESIYGYYKLNDRWVIRKQLELLESIGIDTLFFDTSNGTAYVTSALEIMDVMHEMHMEGVDTPKASFVFPFYNMNYNEWNVLNVYDTIYKNGLYNDCWFYWEGKPCLMAYPDNFANPTGFDDVDALYDEIEEFFTFRPGQPNYRGGAYHKDHWPWLEVYPQNLYGESEKYGCEAMAVGVAQNDNGKLAPMNAENVSGRSYTYKDKFSKLNETSKLYGYNFQEQWDYAIEHDPEFIFVTGWNEYRVQRNTTWQGVRYAFPDTYTDEYSRDAEPIKGDLKDNYYMQMASNIRRFKGVRPTPLASAEKTINVQGDFAQWSDVGPEFVGIKGGTQPRDGYGYSTFHYINSTGRNDIVLSKVARDKENIYFYVETAENLTPYTDPDWMRLFINTDRSVISGWEGYDFVINNVNPTATKALLQKSVDDDWNWEDVAEVDYKVSGNKMMIAVPKSLLGLGDSIDIEFKWNDNMQYKGEAMDFYVNGDSAPVGRFNFHFVTDTAKTLETEELIALKTRAASRIEDMIAMALNNPVAITNGEAVYLDPANHNIKPQIINDKTMVPIRFVSESLGATVTWDDATQTAIIARNNDRIRIIVGSDVMNVGKRKVQLQTPAQLLEDRIYVPLRDVAEGFGIEVFWVDPGLIVVGDGASEAYNYSNVKALLKGNFGI